MSAPIPTRDPPANPPSPFAFDPVSEAVTAVARGEFIVVMDDENRENEGDIVCAASLVTTEGMAFMIRWTRRVFTPTLPVFPFSYHRSDT